jgi:hypothetical protein
MSNPAASNNVQSSDTFPAPRARRDSKEIDRAKREKIVQFMELSKQTVILLLRARGKGDLSIFNEMAIHLDQNKEDGQSRWKIMKDDYDVAKRVFINVSYNR